MGSTLGLRFNSGNYGTNALFNLTNNFGLEMWVRPDASNVTQCLAYNGNSGPNGWGLYLEGGQFKPLFGTVSLFAVTAAPATPGVWTHIALVRNNGTNTFYFNGAPVFTNTAAPNLPTGRFAIAAQAQTLTTEFFAGSMDEVRVFSFAPGGFSTNDLLLNLPAFTNVPIAGLPQVEDSSVAWGDYDNDGRLDFLLTGATNSDGNGRISELWRNTGSGFANVTASSFPAFPNDLPLVSQSSVAWGDYNNDGRLDFLLTGYPGYSQLWQNTVSGFTNVTASAFPPGGLAQVRNSSVAWGDYNNDGRLDFLLTGLNGSSTLLSQLWRNTGSGFTNVTASVAPGLAQVYRSSVAWGDYDHDGRLDFLLTGSIDGSASGGRSQLWRNTGSGFTNVTASVAPGLPEVNISSVAWGDYDNDGRLDFLLAGFSASGRVSQLWRNNTPVANTPPTAPTGLAMTASSNAVLLSWNSATDGQTPAPGLTYNVRAGTTPGGTNLLAAHVNAATGFRRVPALGNAILRHSLPLTGLTNGQVVYWSVQAVDNSFAGGPFATESSVVTIPTLAITPSSSTNAIVSWTPPTWGWRLQDRTNLATGTWSNSPSGELNPAIVPATVPTKFYRLFKP